MENKINLRDWWMDRRAQKNLRILKERQEGEHEILIEEIRIAHHEWSVAQERLDYVVDKDQIDYAILCLEASEKRYEMLLRQAKNNDVSAIEYKFDKAVDSIT